MESGIKYSYHRYARHQLFTCIDTDQVCRVVQRCKVVTLCNCFQNLVCDHNGRSKFLAAVYDTVTDCIYF